MECCEKKLLYEIEAPGLVYLTVDHHKPVYVGFQHKVKLEVSLFDGGKQKSRSYSNQNAKDITKLEGQCGGNRIANIFTGMKASVQKRTLSASSKQLDDGLRSKTKKSKIDLSPDPERNKTDYEDSQLDEPSLTQDNLEVATVENNLSTDPVRNKGGHKEASLTQDAEEVKAGQNDLPMDPHRSESEDEKSQFGAASLTQDDIKAETVDNDTLSEGCTRNDMSRQSDSVTVRQERKSLTGRKARKQKEKLVSTSLQKESHPHPAKEINDLNVRLKGLLNEDTNEVSCQLCLRSFATQEDFINHTYTVTSNPYKCSSCDAKFPFRAYLLVHEKYQIYRANKNKSEVQSYICDVCGVNGRNRSELKIHMLTHTEEFIYQCCICERRSVRWASFTRHQNRHLKADTIRCSCCNQQFLTRAALMKHKLAVMAKCSVCGQEFPNRTIRNFHHQSEHQDVMAQCQLCSHSQFFSPADLAHHMEQHNNNKRKQCDICGLYYSRLDKHKRTHQTPQGPVNKPYTCDLCPKSFRQRGQLTQHRERHSQVRSHKCHLCPKAFNGQNELRRHCRTHSGLLPFQCHICGKRCLEKSNLKTHMRVHSNTKMFHCTVCSQGFNYKSSLEGHLRSKHASVEDEKK